LARAYAKKLTIVNLSETNNADKSSNKTATSSSSSGDYSPIDYQHQHQLNQQEELKNMMHAQLTKLENQKVLLAKSLVEIEDFKTALRIIEKLPPWYLATYPDVSYNICKSIDSSIVDAIYKKCNSLSKYLKDKYSINDFNRKLAETKPMNGLNIENQSCFDENEQENMIVDADSLDEMLGIFVDSILPILSAIGPGVSYNTVLFTKLIRICIAFLENNSLSVSSSSSATASSSSNSGNYASQEQLMKDTPPSTPSNTATGSPPPQSQKQVSPVLILANLSPNELAFYNQIYTLLNDVLMPSLSMITMNPCLAIELWNLLKLFPYEMR
jgi:hypothetical protein